MMTSQRNFMQEAWRARGLRALAGAGAPVDGVPGALIRRAVLFHQDDLVVSAVRDAERDALSFLLHDYAAIRDELTEMQTEIWRTKLQTMMRASAVRPSGLRRRGLAGVDVLQGAAAEGHEELLEELLEFNAGGAMEKAPMDMARMAELACINGHVGVVALLEKKVGKDEAEALKEGVVRAVTALEATRDVEALARLKGITIGGLTVEVPSIARDSNGQRTPLCPEDDCAAILVLSDRSLVRYIGSFHQSPLGLINRRPAGISGTFTHSVRPGQIVGLLPRAAIVKGDLDALQLLYEAYRVDPADPNLSFRLAMHFAACEGQLEIVKWLHSRRDPMLRCRSDTMAMAARCGWSEVVEWLYVNCSDSAQTMSESVVHDAARWGHVGILDFIHRHSLCEISASVLETAAACGQISVLRYLRSICPHLDLHSAMNQALREAQVEAVKWLHEESDEKIDTTCVAIALQSTAPSTRSLLEFLMTVIDVCDPSVRHYAREHLALVCKNHDSEVVRILLPLVTEDAFALSNCFLEVVQCGREDTVRLLLVHCEDDPSVMSRALDIAVRARHLTLVRVLVESGRVPSGGLAAAFRFAARNFPTNIYELLLELGVDKYCEDSDKVVAEAATLPSPVNVVVAREFHERLREFAKANSKDDVRTLLLAHANIATCTKDDIMDDLPPVMAPELVRFWLHRGHHIRWGTRACFSGIALEEEGFLTIEELERVQQLKDGKLTGYVLHHREHLISRETCEEIVLRGVTPLMDHFKLRAYLNTECAPTH